MEVSFVGVGFGRVDCGEVSRWGGLTAMMRVCLLWLWDRVHDLLKGGEGVKAVREGMRMGIEEKRGAGIITRPGLRKKKGMRWGRDAMREREK